MGLLFNTYDFCDFKTNLFLGKGELYGKKTGVL